MKTINNAAVAAVLLSGVVLCAQADTSPAVTQLLEQYRSEGAAPFNAMQGQHLWFSRFTPQGSPSSQDRGCTDCHGKDLAQPGRHIRTQKVIDPLAPSSNSTRLTDPGTIEKWLRRNCKWTLGRECNPQEKGDLLTWISQQ